jgi:hypothetical protein
MAQARAGGARGFASYSPYQLQRTVAMATLSGERRCTEPDGRLGGSRSANRSLRILGTPGRSSFAGARGAAALVWPRSWSESFERSWVTRATVSRTDLAAKCPSPWDFGCPIRKGMSPGTMRMARPRNPRHRASPTRPRAESACMRSAAMSLRSRSRSSSWMNDRRVGTTSRTGTNDRHWVLPRRQRARRSFVRPGFDEFVQKPCEPETLRDTMPNATPTRVYETPCDLSRRGGGRPVLGYAAMPVWQQRRRSRVGAAR